MGLNLSVFYCLRRTIATCSYKELFLILDEYSGKQIPNISLCQSYDRVGRVPDYSLPSCAKELLSEVN